MRHRKAGVKLNRTSSHRNAMFRNMVTSLFKYERIQTTDTKAKALRAWADHLITLAKRGDLHARRQALAIVREKAVVHKLFNEAAEKFGAVSGGYTRIVKMGHRPGDAAPVSIIELITAEGSQKPKADKKKKRGDAKKRPAAKKQAQKKAAAPEEAKAVKEEAPVVDAAEEKTAELQKAEEAAAAAPVDEAPDAEEAPGEEKDKA